MIKHQTIFDQTEARTARHVGDPCPFCASAFACLIWRPGSAVSRHRSEPVAFCPRCIAYWDLAIDPLPEPIINDIESFTA